MEIWVGKKISRAHNKDGKQQTEVLILMSTIQIGCN